MAEELGSVSGGPLGKFAFPKFLLSAVPSPTTVSFAALCPRPRHSLGSPHCAFFALPRQPGVENLSSLTPRLSIGAKTGNVLTTRCLKTGRSPSLKGTGGRDWLRVMLLPGPERLEPVTSHFSSLPGLRY